MADREDHRVGHHVQTMVLDLTIIKAVLDLITTTRATVLDLITVQHRVLDLITTRAAVLATVLDLITAQHQVLDLITTTRAAVLDLTTTRAVDQMDQSEVVHLDLHTMVV
jgi:hypothetical protein